MRTYRFSKLSETAQRNAYNLYCAAMDDDLNRENIVSFEQYGIEAEWEGLLFSLEGVALGVSLYD